MDPRVPAITGGKVAGSQVDPDPWCSKASTAYVLFEEVLRTPMIYRTHGIYFTSPDAGNGHDDDTKKNSPTEIASFPAYQAMPADASVSTKAHSMLIHKVKCLCYTLSQAQNTLAAAQSLH